MRAIQILQTGGPDKLTLQNLPEPIPGPGEALLRIEASGVNFIDTYLREGRYAATLPYTLGQEAAGKIVSLGPQIEGAPDLGLRPGMHVCWTGIARYLCRTRHPLPWIASSPFPTASPPRRPRRSFPRA